MICLLDGPVDDCKTRTTLVAGVVTTDDVDAFCTAELEFKIVAVERTPVVFVDVMIVAFVDIDGPVSAGGGFDLNAVMVIPLEGTMDVDVLVPAADLPSEAAEEGVIGSITKLLLLDETEAGVGLPLEDGITWSEEPKVVTILTVGGVEIIPGLFLGSAVNLASLKLARISATFLRSF